MPDNFLPQESESHEQIARKTPRQEASCQETETNSATRQAVACVVDVEGRPARGERGGWNHCPRIGVICFSGFTKASQDHG